MQVSKILGLMAVLAVGGAVTLLLSLVSTNPSKLGPAGVTAWFLILLGVGTCALTVGLYWVKSSLKVHSLDTRRLTFSWRQGFLLASAGVMFLALSSLRQLSLRDVVLFGILLALIEFYFRNR